MRHTLLALALISALQAHGGTLTVKVVNTRPAHCALAGEFIDEVLDGDGESPFPQFNQDPDALCDFMEQMQGSVMDPDADLVEACHVLDKKECQ